MALPRAGCIQKWAGRVHGAMAKKNDSAPDVLPAILRDIRRNTVETLSIVRWMERELDRLRQELRDDAAAR